MRAAATLAGLGLLLATGAAQAAWLERQPKSDPVHKAVAAVAASGCVVSAEDWDRLYASLGGAENDGDYHILMMYQHGELTSDNGGATVRFKRVAGC